MSRGLDSGWNFEASRRTALFHGRDAVRLVAGPVKGRDDLAEIQITILVELVIDRVLPDQHLGSPLAQRRPVYETQECLKGSATFDGVIRDGEPGGFRQETVEVELRHCRIARADHRDGRCGVAAEEIARG